MLCSRDIVFFFTRGRDEINVDINTTRFRENPRFTYYLSSNTPSRRIWMCNGTVSELDSLDGCNRESVELNPTNKFPKKMIYYQIHNFRIYISEGSYFL